VTGDLSDKAYHDLRYRLSWRSRKPRFRIAWPAGPGRLIFYSSRRTTIVVEFLVC